MNRQNISRRHFLRASGLAVAAAGLPFHSRLFAAPSRELKIARIRVQDAVGRRLTPVAPNAYAGYRGFRDVEPILRIETAQGIEGIARCTAKPEDLKELLGLDPFKLFTWDSQDHITGRAEAHEGLLKRMLGADVALLDLLGKALKRPVASVLGTQVRDSVQIYDGTVYMEDLLNPEQQKDVAYFKGSVPADPVEWVGLKAAWVVSARSEGFKTIKIKIGRVKWMDSFEAAVARDIAVTHAVRKAMGPDIKLIVDGNGGYKQRPLAAAEYAEACAGDNIYAFEEMFSELDLPKTQEFKKRLRAAGNPAKLAAGESHGGGIRENVYTQRFESAKGSEPLIDIEQADMNQHGYLYLKNKAAKQAKLGMTMAPHNFASKMGFYAQVHLGLVTPNWELCEVDDIVFPALQGEGFQINKGIAKLTGQPGLGVRLKEDALEKASLELKA